MFILLVSHAFLLIKDRSRVAIITIDELFMCHSCGIDDRRMSGKCTLPFSFNLVESMNIHFARNHGNVALM